MLLRSAAASGVLAAVAEGSGEILLHILLLKNDLVCR